MYFLIGKEENDIKAHLQFSFKYRLFDEEGVVVKKFPFLKKFHLGYTQKSLWNISASSSPFEDSSYRPSLFWELIRLKLDKKPQYFRIGYEHESNGQGGIASRSIDTLFAMTFWDIPFSKNDLFIGTKIYFYVSKGRYNENIEDYRGWVDLIIRYGGEEHWLLNLILRNGSKNKLTFQFDISHPVRNKIFSRTGGYFQIQLFYGYGETFLNYNKKEGINFRLGYAIVR